MNAHRGHYAATVKYLEKVTHTGHHCEPAFCRSSIKFMKGKRPKQKIPAVLDHNLQKEIDFLEEKEKQSDVCILDLFIVTFNDHTIVLQVHSKLLFSQDRSDRVIITLLMIICDGKWS